MSRDEKIVKILKRVLPIMSILTLFVFVMLINKKSYALFHKRIETDITIHINTADRLPKPSTGLGKDMLEYDIEAKKEICNPIIEEDGITYLSGDNDCVNFNYVWYSGKLWRITAIYPDGTMKMVTQDAITAINWGADETYKDSWIYQWLNEDFKDTLYNYQNIIVQNANWNSTLDDSSTENNVVKPPTDASADIVKGDVGSLNAYEYYQSYKNTTYSKGYLNIGYCWWLITPYSDSRVRGVYSSYNDIENGAFFTWQPNFNPAGVRPSINLKSNIELSGEGTKSNPYTIVGDKTAGKTGELINTRLSGEYIRVDNKVYRIVGIENGTTKLTSVDYVRDESGAVLEKKIGSNANWGTSVATDSDDKYWSYYLNNTWLTENLKQYITEGTYYLGQVDNVSYKNTICSASNTSETTKNCAKTASTWTGKVGLPRVGEMFSAQLGEGESTSSSIWLITPHSESQVCFIVLDGNLFYDMTSSYGVRPSINLKSEVKIAGGSGTEEDPYTVSVS